MLWQGSQQAVDATIINPLTRTGAPQPGADAHPGTALDGAARRKRHHTYPKLVRARRCRLGVGVGVRFSVEAATWLRLLAQHRASAAPAATRLGLGRLVVRLAGPPPPERCTCGRPLAASRPRQPAGATRRGGEKKTSPLNLNRHSRSAGCLVLVIVLYSNRAASCPAWPPP